MKRWKEILKDKWSKHWNCLPGFILGLIVLAAPQVTKLEFFTAWAIMMGFLWQRPVKEDEEQKIP